jgi:two-component system, cell cycle sensor histidine kinase and response regulator CckA
MVSERDAVLIVDDEPDLVNLFTDALMVAELNAIGFDNPLTALDYISENHSTICLVVTDWKMPQINGFELTKKVAEIDNEIGVMLMSAYELEQDQLKEINKDDYLKKPVHMAKLIDSIKREYFAKDCKDTCNEESSDKKEETDLVR